MLQKPQQRLAHGTEFHEFTKDKLNSPLHAQVGILFQTLVLALDIANRSGNDQLATARLFPARFYRALTQQVQLILVQATFRPSSKRSLLSLGA